MGEKLEYYKSFWETYLKYNEGAKMSRTIYNIFPSFIFFNGEVKWFERKC